MPVSLILNALCEAEGVMVVDSWHLCLQIFSYFLLFLYYFIFFIFTFCFVLLKAILLFFIFNYFVCVLMYVGIYGIP